MSLTVSIITPERAWQPMQADSVTLPAFDGEMGILPRHAPLLTQLGTGRLVIKHRSEADNSYALRGGVAQVLDDEVRILAESVVDTADVTETDLVRQLKELDEADYDDEMEEAGARSKAHWIATQLRSKGKDVPTLKKLG